MNERIKELSGKALDKAVPYTWTKLDYEQIQELLACHAELIVKECAFLLENSVDDKRLELSPELFKMITNISKAQAQYIREHFGVEE